MTTKEFLIRARNRIEGRWTKGRLGFPDGEVCAVGGMLATLREEHPDMRFSETTIFDNPCANELTEIGKRLKQPKLRHYVESHGITGLIHGIEAYNDHPTRKEGHVLKLFDQMIAIADKLEKA